MMKMERPTKPCSRCGEGTLWRVDGKPVCPLCIPQEKSRADTRVDEQIQVLEQELAQRKGEGDEHA